MSRIIDRKSKMAEKYDRSVLGKLPLFISMLVAVLILLFTFVVLLGACQKDSGTSSQSAANSAKISATTAITTKTTVKPAGSSASSAVTTTSGAQSTSAAAAGTSGAGSEGGVGDAGDTGGSGEAEEGDSGSIEDVIDFTVQEKLGEEMNYDLGGMKITYITDSASNVWSNDESMALNYRTLDKRIKEAEKKYNFIFEAKSAPGTVYWSEIISQTMAGVKYCDIIQLNATYAYPTWILNNIIVPLDEYIDYESPIIRANSYMYYSSAWGGRHWGITCIYEHAFANIMYNRALLGREGITDIIDLVEADRWTWNEFVDIAVRCTRDLNGDGITDQWGIVERNRASFCNQILYSNGVYPLKFDSNGNPSYNLSNASAARALQLISDLSFVYRVCKDDNIKSVPTYTGGFGAMYVDQYWYNPNMLKAGVDSAIAPLPMGPDVDHYQNTEKPTDLFAILSTCEKPKEICRIFAECMIIWDESLNPADDYNEFLQLKGGVSWLWNPANLSRKMSTEREYEQVFKRLLPYFRPDMTQGYSGVASKVDSEIYKNIINSSKSVADAVESLRPVIDSILDSYK